MGGRCGTVWSVCLCSEACAGRGGARDGAVVGRVASARHIMTYAGEPMRIGRSTGPGGGSAGAASVVWCRVCGERISINVS